MHYKRKFCGRSSPRAIGMQMVDQLYHHFRARSFQGCRRNE
jgi:hypothetical protein